MYGKLLRPNIYICPRLEIFVQGVLGRNYAASNGAARTPLDRKLCHKPPPLEGNSEGSWTDMFLEADGRRGRAVLVRAGRSASRGARADPSWHLFGFIVSLSK